MQVVCDDLIELIEEAGTPDQFEMLFSLIQSEYYESGEDAPSEEGSYYSNLSLLMAWQVADYLQMVAWERPVVEQDEAYASCVRAFKRCVEARL